MAEDEPDDLYWAKPDEFTALRNKLSVAAKHRGHDAAAKRITAARKPTTAAWVVNRLALCHKEVNSASVISATACAPRTLSWTATVSGNCPPSNELSSTSCPEPRCKRPG